LDILDAYEMKWTTPDAAAMQDGHQEGPEAYRHLHDEQTARNGGDSNDRS
jgi:hypothetical protein